MNKGRFVIPAVLAILVPALILGAIDSPAVLASKVTGFLLRFPAANGPERDSACGDLIRLGPGAIADICGRLRAPGGGDDTAARFALNGLAVYVKRTGAEKERDLYARALAKSLERIPEKEVKAFLISQLQLAGGRESVSTLAKYLTDGRLADPAARALLAIDKARTAGIFLKSLNSASAEARVTIVQALGEARSREAARRILPFAESPDQKLRQAALAALANIGDASAGPVLSRVRVAASAIERAKAPTLYLLYARRRAEAGGTSEALRIAREILRDYSSPGESHIASSALSLIVALLQEKALPDLLAAADSKDSAFRAAALELAQSMPGTDVTARWAEKAAIASAETRADIIAMLGRRKDPSAFPAIREALRSEDRSVRLAAISASKIGGAAALPDLYRFFASMDQDEITAAKTVLLGYGRETVVTESVRHMNDCSVPGRAALIDVLAEKGATDRVDLVFSQALSQDAPVRASAIRGLARLSSEADIPRLAELLLAATDADDIVNLQNAIAAAAGRNPILGERADSVLAIMAKTPGARRGILLRVLPGIGGDKALEAVVSEIRGKDPQVRMAAMYALSQWPDFDAAPELHKIIAAPADRKQLLLALEAYVRLVKSADFPRWKKIELLINVLGQPKDDADKKLVLLGLAELRAPDSFRILGDYLTRPVLTPTVIQSLEDMASEQGPDERWLSGHEAISILRRAETLAQDPSEKERLGRLIAERLKQGGFVPLFNGRDLDGWKGLVADPPKRAKMTPAELAKAQAGADEAMRSHWRVENGTLIFDGKGDSLCTGKDYTDFEMLVDWKIEKGGDSGIYLRGSPQVQIWDATANPVGSGGLYNNQKGPHDPLEVADRPIGEWNTFRIIMIGDRVTVYLNDRMVVDNTVLENYWERDKPIYPAGQIELQAHGNVLYFKNIYIREIPRDAVPSATSAYAVSDSEKEDGFVPLFNGADLSGWTGDTKGYAAENGKIVIDPERGSGNLYTEKEYADFVLRFEFKLTPAANNGIGIRAPLEGDAAYVGMEIQILEDGSPVYWNLHPYQYHGSIYGVVPARRGILRPIGEWNTEEITAAGRRITVRVNGTTIVDADIDKASAGGTIDGRDHPGLKRQTGHIGFLGHGSIVEFRNIRIREIK